MKLKSIAVICFYFGEFPEWFEIFFESLKRNKTIDFFFYTDNNFQNYVAPNVFFKYYSYNDYVKLIVEKTNINFTPENPYKICDFRPLLGIIHYQDIEKYDFYGYADIDLFFGDIRSFYTHDILRKHDVLSTHQHTFSDHFILFRNKLVNREMYKYIGGWKEKLQSPTCVGIGEDFLYEAYNKYINEKCMKNKGFNKLFYYYFGIKLYMKEQFTTPFTPISWLDDSKNSFQPSEWLYKDGVITNKRDGNQNFMYIHFMNFKSSKYRHDGTKAPWEGLKDICLANKNDINDGIVINQKGIYPLFNT